MTFKTSVLIILFLLIVQSGFSQYAPKNNLYLFFKENLQKTMFKQIRTDTALYNRTSKLRSPAYNYDIYYYRGLVDKSGRKREFALATIDKNFYYITDSSFVTFASKKIEEVMNIAGIDYDTTDYKRFPFRRVYIVEFLAENKYKVIQVNTYMGTEFY